MVLVGAVGVVNGGAARRCVRRPAAAMVMVRSLSPGLLRVREYGNMEIWKYGIWKYMANTLATTSFSGFLTFRKSGKFGEIGERVIKVK